ncbi:uncharacterized protein LOC124407791 [Diprion similis]|uniref:uncharacterized protein LOC124407791 n=1 Tax=Diprion similis TaxID=362088 RepID=UPI001EF972CB|nr:uncharacterized protein LOC124407791 [Diprion similis]
MTARYECPDHTKGPQDIHIRYQDTALVIFKEQQNRPRLQNYLSFGPSRKTMEYTNNGNDAVIVKNVARSTLNTTAAGQISIKPSAACSII